VASSEIYYLLIATIHFLPALNVGSVRELTNVALVLGIFTLWCSCHAIIIFGLGHYVTWVCEKIDHEESPWTASFVKEALTDPLSPVQLPNMELQPLGDFKWDQQKNCPDFKTVKKKNDYCFKTLSFGVLSYIATSNLKVIYSSPYHICSMYLLF
jgi:hypothetical protein